MEELLEEMQAFGVAIDELDGDPDRVVGMELAQVAHVHLGGEERAVPPFHVVRPDARQRERLVDRPVEQHVVIGHVEVAVVVDPGRLDPHHRGDERREEQRFKVEAVEHGSGNHFSGNFRKVRHRMGKARRVGL